MLPESATDLMREKRSLLARMYIATLPHEWNYHDKRAVIVEIMRIAKEGEKDMGFDQTKVGKALAYVKEDELSDEEYNSVLQAMQVHETLKSLKYKVLATHHLTPKVIKELKDMALDARELLTDEDIEMIVAQSPSPVEL